MIKYENIDQEIVNDFVLIFCKLKKQDAIKVLKEYEKVYFYIKQTWDRSARNIVKNTCHFEKLIFSISKFLLIKFIFILIRWIILFLF